MYLCTSGLICISNQSGSCLSPHELWRIFNGKSSHFCARYKVFKHFKDIGYFPFFVHYSHVHDLHVIFSISFVIHSGVHIGVDFTLYRNLPEYCHSELCVLVQPEAQSRLSVTELSTLTRAMPDVMKSLVIAYVIEKEVSSSSSAVDQALVTFDDELQKLEVRLVTAMIRRFLCCSDKPYPTATTMQAKYKKAAGRKKAILETKQKIDIAEEKPVIDCNCEEGDS